MYDIADRPKTPTADQLRIVTRRAYDRGYFPRSRTLPAPAEGLGAEYDHWLVAHAARVGLSRGVADRQAQRQYNPEEVPA